MGKKQWLCIITLVLIFINLNLFTSLVLARQNKISGYSTKDNIQAGETVSYQFSNNLNFELKTNEFISLDLEYENTIRDREVALEIKSNNSLSIEIRSKETLKSFGYSEEPKGPKKGDTQWQYKYNCIFRLQSNSSIDKMTFTYKLDLDYGLDPSREYSIAYFDENEDSWQLLDTEVVEDNDETYLQADISDVEADTAYYITIYEIEQDYTWIWIVVIAAIVIIGLAIAISKTDFIEYLKTRHTYIEKGAHRLTMEEVLENENRDKILDLVLKDPGIHFNELLRQTGLAAGNLVWHLDILETYKIIGRKRIGNFIAYFPYYQKNPISNIDLKLSKSKLTLEILEMIEGEPGIYNNLITKRKKVDHKTIHYHLEKLIELGLVIIKKEGRKKKIFPNFDSEYFNGKEGESEEDSTNLDNIK